MNFTEYLLLSLIQMVHQNTLATNLGAGSYDPKPANEIMEEVIKQAREKEQHEQSQESESEIFDGTGNSDEEKSLKKRLWR